MPAKSRWERSMILTRYAMGGFEFSKELFDIPALAPLGLFEALANSLVRVGAGGDVKEPLIGLGVLDNSGSLAFHREHHWAFGLLELFHKDAGPATKGSQRLDILGDVKHGFLRTIEAPF